MAADRARGNTPTPAAKRPIAKRPAKPATREQRHAKAMSAFESQQFPRAQAMYEALLEDYPNDFAAAFYLAQIHTANGQIDDALTMAGRAAALSPKTADIRRYNAHLLALAVRDDEAIDELNAVLALTPNDGAACVQLASIYERRHELDTARSMVERAEANQADIVEVALMKSTLLMREKKYEEASAQLEGLNVDHADPAVASAYFKQIGGIQDKLKNYDQAFEALGRSAAHIQRAPRFLQIDTQHHQRLTENLRSVDFADVCRKASARSCSDGLPRLAFIVGFPRSGTTLTGQILNAHSEVRVTPELATLRDVHIKLANDRGLEYDRIGDAISTLTGSEIVALRAFYWERIRVYCGEIDPHQMLIDKMPLNIMLAPLINVLFPDARIITVIRDPRDVCISNYMQNFKINHFSVNLLTWSMTTAYYAMVMSLWRHHRLQLTMPVFELSYEAMAGDFETQARAMIEFLELPWSDDVLSYHEKAREQFINTPSYEAVTRKVNTSAVARWKRYAQHIADENDTLGPLIEAFGYDATADAMMSM